MWAIYEVPHATKLRINQGWKEGVRCMWYIESQSLHMVTDPIQCRKFGWLGESASSECDTDVFEQSRCCTITEIVAYQA